jgi:phosphatidylglycerophosphatase A
MASLLRFFWQAVASGLGLGLLPGAPGTWGAAGAIGALWALHRWYPVHFPGEPGTLWPFALVLLGLFFLGTTAARAVERHWGEDASRVVVDEWFGQWVALAGLPFSPAVALAGFVLFRVLDIAKPLYIRRMEKLGGGLGVMMDDLLAGVYANLLLQAAVRLGWLG